MGCTGGWEHFLRTFTHCSTRCAFMLRVPTAPFRLARPLAPYCFVSFVMYATNTARGWSSERWKQVCDTPPVGVGIKTVDLISFRLVDRLVLVEIASWLCEPGRAPTGQKGTTTYRINCAAECASRYYWEGGLMPTALGFDGLAPPPSPFDGSWK